MSEVMGPAGRGHEGPYGMERRSGKRTIVRLYDTGATRAARTWEADPSMELAHNELHLGTSGMGTMPRGLTMAG